MKKKYLIYGISGLFVIALLIGAYYIFLPQQFIQDTTCYGESDAGYDIYNKGTVTFTTGGGSPIQYIDECVNANTLREYNCVDHPTWVSFHDVECICSDGVCESDLCSGVSCRDKCDAGNLLYEGQCDPLSGECVYRQEICQFGCENARCREPSCVIDSDCNSNEECKDNVCVEKSECMTDTDCASNEKCLDNKCVTDYQCTSDSDCELDEDCINNVCVEKPGCLDNSDCANTEICKDGKCEEASCTEGEITEYFECSEGNRVPSCMCIDGAEACIENPETQCKQDWTVHIIIGIIVFIILLILLYALIRKK